MNLENFTPQQKLIFAAAGGVLLLLVVALFLVGGSGGVPKIVSATTEAREGEFIPRPVTTFTLDKEVGDGIIAAESFPRFAHTLDVSGETVTVTPVQDLADGVPYEIKLLFAKDAQAEQQVVEFVDPPEIADRGDGLQDFDVNAHHFRTPEFAKRQEFLDSLPKDFGRFTINRISERGLYVYVESGSADQQRDKILKLLADNGITSDRYDIDIDEPYEPGSNPTQDLIFDYD